MRVTFISVVLVYCVLSVLLSIAYTAYLPEYSDAHLFAYIGNQWLQGELPYIDLWDNKPPGIFALVAFVFSLFPESFTALAVTDGLFSIATIAAVYAFCRRCSLPTDAAMLSTAMAAGASSLIYYTERGVLPEVYLVMPATLAMMCFVIAYPTFRLKWMYAAGICAGVATLFKPTGLAPLLAQSAYLGLLLLSGNLNFRQLLLIMTVLVLGVVTIWMPFVFYFLVEEGLKQLMYASFAYNVEYGLASQPSLLIVPFETIERLKPMASLVVATFILVVLWVGWVGRVLNNKVTFAKTGPELLVPLVLLWVFADLAGALAGGRSYGHYFLPATISMSVAAGFLFWWLVYKSKNQIPALPLRTTLMLLLIAPIVFEQPYDLRNFASTLGTTSHPSIVAGKYLKSVSSPKETLFTWNYIPSVYYYSGLSSPVKQIDAHHMDDSPAAYEHFGPEILNDLCAHPPTYIVDHAREVETRVSNDRFYSEFRKFIDAGYDLIKTIKPGHLNIYKRRDMSVNKSGPDCLVCCSPQLNPY